MKDILVGFRYLTYILKIINYQKLEEILVLNFVEMQLESIITIDSLPLNNAVKIICLSILQLD